jgi:hypothetical protein
MCVTSERRMRDPAIPMAGVHSSNISSGSRDVTLRVWARWIEQGRRSAANLLTRVGGQ